MSEPLPPLSIEEAADIVTRLRAVVGGPGVVMIGGSALAFWHNHYSDSPPLDVATTDLDFQGGDDDARKAGLLLDGHVNVPKFGDHTPNTGIVTFTDRQGTRRLVDFLQQVAAIALVPAFSRELLDQGAAPREVLNLNEEIYRLATNDQRALNLYLQENIDVADAALEDDRLPDAYRSRRLPQLQTHLQDKRERREAARKRRAEPGDSATAERRLPGEQTDLQGSHRNGWD